MHAASPNTQNHRIVADAELKQHRNRTAKRYRTNKNTNIKEPISNTPIRINQSNCLAASSKELLVALSIYFANGLPLFRFDFPPFFLSFVIFGLRLCSVASAICVGHVSMCAHPCVCVCVWRHLNAINLCYCLHMRMKYVVYCRHIISLPATERNCVEHGIMAQALRIICVFMCRLSESECTLSRSRCRFYHAIPHRSPSLV